MRQSEDALERIKAELRSHKDLELRVIRAGAGRHVNSLLPDGTHLFGAIRRGLRDVPKEQVAGTIIISDGQIHDLPDPKNAEDLGGPVHLLLSGEREERDRRLVVVKAPRYGIVGETLNLTLRVEDNADGGANGPNRLRHRRCTPRQRRGIAHGRDVYYHRP